MHEQNANSRFNAELSEAVAKIGHHFSEYEQVLKGAYGYMLATGPVSRREWHTYINALRLDDSYPGIHGIGFAQYFRSAEMTAHVASVRAEGFSEYKVWPDTLGGEYTAIIYLEPFSGRNLRALGYDMFSNPVRRAAMARARDSGEVTLSGKVRLVQETSEDIQAGVLMYIPYYGPTGLPETLEQRRSSLAGYIYAPFRMDDFVTAVLRAELRDLELRIFDSHTDAQDNLLFESDKNQPGRASLPKFRRTISIPLYGQTWTIEALSRPGFENAVNSQEPQLVLLGGTLLSILAAIVSFMLLVNKEKVGALARANAELVSAIEEQQVATRARQEADMRIRQQASLLDKATDAIIIRGIDHRIHFWNHGAQRLYGWKPEEVMGKSIEEVIYGDTTSFRNAHQVLLREGEWRGEIMQLRKDGGMLTAEAHWTLVADDDGRPHSIFAINTDITQRKMAEKEIQHLAFYDSLTGLPNRQLLLDRLRQALAGSTRNRQTGALLFIDLDNFKLLNDTLGHDVGDLLLRQVAPRLISCVRDGDTVARLGGDEFVVVLVSNFSEHPEEAVTQIRAICERILAAFSQPFSLGAYKHHSTPSIGIALFNDQSSAMDELLKQADLAMYQAKASGRNSICFFNPGMQVEMDARVVLESDLHKSWERNEFVLHYQPQGDGQRVIGAEALVRWQHPRRGLLSPSEFIPHAEETGLILPLGTWVLETACAQLAAWARDPAMAWLNLAVNVSPRQFCQPDFVEQVLCILDHAGVNPQKLKLELTESLLLNNMDDTITKIAALKARGVGFALDDFGTGYSSLYYLKCLPLDWVKIDQFFVRDVLTNPNDATIVRAIILLARSMGLEVIAEGVETEAQKLFLAQHGCNAYQGYLLSPPLSSGQFQEFMQQRGGG
ncbi:bifunctional diguanylate cyclase/phosphodiesterase [Nitrosovibrio tenuis]|uniref:PAS domain S-box-containing protein/diguanylate cyclase (GGDEF) domain-containing protein n=1 Tax=Nitrosovibrio tenuis TaxID=1233 RepID=A0A1H7J9Y3_9PROT|nr:EAL domain-containing protein [Nitrosovibrio tenuis]SEK71533.1 PAS domain S-box-containing protein/diguanylate cyclase (GGDEF) domain-containing protein [Nitrosovibrio tenuis]